MTLPRSYVETSVISYLTSRPSRDVLLAARQTWTREWWDAATGHWELVISDLVWEESGRGDAQAAAGRLAVLHGLVSVPVTREARDLAGKLIAVGAIPATEPEDALHIALATVHGAHYLVSWNFAHIVGPDAKLKLHDALVGCGYIPALLTTPEELLETL